MLDIIKVSDFKSASDPVRTEETIYKQLVSNKNKIDSIYSYVAMPLAETINSKGVAYTQNQINFICNKFNYKKLFFVCQHILVKNLNFHNHLVFTPHATIFDSFVAIPHYSCNYDLKYVKPWEERKYLFSFMGSFRTHPTRAAACNKLKNEPGCIFIDTGDWHFHHKDSEKENNKNKYIELLGDTKYSLCPRGTGPSTIRMWESMAMGSCPIILSDYLKYPLEFDLDSNLWTSVKENFTLSDIKSALPEDYDNKEYFKYFSNDKLYESILREI
jgi:hypothetical protein